MSILRLQTIDPAIWAETLRAVEASATVKPAVKIRCSRCGSKLGYVGETARGALFTSSWSVPLTHEEPLPGAVLVSSSGPPPLTAETHGVIALLRMPNGSDPRCPDLMVRCTKHGDAVLDPSEVLRRLDIASKSPVWKVAPAERHFYSWPPPDPGGLNTTAARERKSVTEWKLALRDDD